jgi:hypothetical protein
MPVDFVLAEQSHGGRKSPATRPLPAPAIFGKTKYPFFRKRNQPLAEGFRSFRATPQSPASKRTEIMVDTAAMNTTAKRLRERAMEIRHEGKKSLIRLPVWMLDSWKKPRRYLNRPPTN